MNKEDVMEIKIEIPGVQEMKLIVRYIKEFMLDDEGLEREQFIIARINNTLVGFGRLRQHPDCVELCTLGVLTEYRGKGIGKKLVEELIKRTSSKLYLVCIIPGFFQKLDFEIVKEVPPSIVRKYEICTTKLKVAEPYYMMRLEES